MPRINDYVMVNPDEYDEFQKWKKLRALSAVGPTSEHYMLMYMEGDELIQAFGPLIGWQTVEDRLSEFYGDTRSLYPNLLARAMGAGLSAGQGGAASATYHGPIPPPSSNQVPGTRQTAPKPGDRRQMLVCTVVPIANVEHTKVMVPEDGFTIKKWE